MFRHVLVPLDGSTLAECVLPHAVAAAASAGARVTLVHALEPPTLAGRTEPADPVRWQLAVNEAETYLAGVAGRLEDRLGPVAWRIFEGEPMNNLIEFVGAEDVDLIALSSHGRSGPMGWNMGSVARKIAMHARVSVLMVRAFDGVPLADVPIRYRRILLPLDGSRRSESVLQTARRLANEHGAGLVVANVVERPVLPSRLPLPADEAEVVERFVELCHKHAEQYVSMLRDELSAPGREVQTRVAISPDTLATLHELRESEQADLVLMSAHGASGSARWPFGSTVLHFLAHGTSTLLVMQDLARDELQRSQAERAAQERQGHE